MQLLDTQMNGQAYLTSEYTVCADLSSTRTSKWTYPTHNVAFCAKSGCNGENSPFVLFWGDLDPRIGA